MAGFPYPALMLIAPVTGVILSLTVFLMPLWHCRRDQEFRIHLPNEFRICGGDGYPITFEGNIRFEENSGTKTWTPTFAGRPFRSNAELAVAVKSAVQGHEVAVALHAPNTMATAELVSVLRELECAGVRCVLLSLSR